MDKIKDWFVSAPIWKKLLIVIAFIVIAYNIFDSFNDKCPVCGLKPERSYVRDGKTVLNDGKHSWVKE